MSFRTDPQSSIAYAAAARHARPRWDQPHHHHNEALFRNGRDGLAGDSIVPEDFPVSRDRTLWEEPLARHEIDMPSVKHIYIYPLRQGFRQKLRRTGSLQG